jgi:hypothetical protein
MSLVSFYDEGYEVDELKACELVTNGGRFPFEPISQFLLRELEQRPMVGYIPELSALSMAQMCLVCWCCCGTPFMVYW